MPSGIAVGPWRQARRRGVLPHRLVCSPFGDGPTATLDHLLRTTDLFHPHSSDSEVGAPLTRLRRLPTRFDSNELGMSIKEVVLSGDGYGHLELGIGS